MLRKTTSLVLLLSFIVMVISGIAEFISPFGRLSMMIQWKMLGLDKMQWQALHITFMMLFTLAGILHIIINFKAIKNYLKNRSRKLLFATKEMMIALVITIALFTATVMKVEPVEKFVKLNKSFNSYWIAEFKKERMSAMGSR